MNHNPSQYAFVVRPEELMGGSFHIKAMLVAMSDNGEILDYPYEDRYLNDFLVSAYVEPEDDGAIFGMRSWFCEVYSTELDNAEKMAKFLRKIQRGMDKLNESAGYVKDGDFFSYLTRVAAVLKVRRFYVRNTYRAREMRRELYTSMTGHMLQGYIDGAIDDIRNRRVHLYGN